MATAANANNLAMMLATEMEKQREHLKEGMAGLIKTSLAPIQASIANFHEMVDTLGRRVAAVETTAGDNFDALFKAEKAITELQTLNATLVDRVDDLENRYRRVNLRIIKGVVWDFGHRTSFLSEPVCYLSLETVFNTFNSVLLVVVHLRPTNYNSRLSM